MINFCYWLFLIPGIRCPPPPPLPINYVCRQTLLEEMVNKLCQSAIDTDHYGTSLTVTGAGGFGKTSIVTALCHHHVIMEQFKDGVVFIELGPQATDPSIKLSQLYHLLTGQYLKQGDINHAEQEINQLTNLYCRNLLVIIDDVWHVEDAEPIVKAFSNCKIVLTTRMNDIEQYIPTKHVVSVGPMEHKEAVSLLTCGVIDISQLSPDHVNLLDELVQDVHLWPLLLSLVRGQLFHCLKQYKLPSHKAIQSVQAKLNNKGLTALDKNNIARSRKYAVKSCIEVTLDLLTKSLSEKIKSLLLWTGIGTSLQTAVLHNLWNIPEEEATDMVDLLWAYGLVLFTDIMIPPHNNKQHCVEVHAVISQYIIECMDRNETWDLSPFGGLDSQSSVLDGLTQLCLRSFGVSEVSALTSKEFLMFSSRDIVYNVLPFYLKVINMHTMTDPLTTEQNLKHIHDALISSKNIETFLPSITTEVQSLINDCHKIINDVHKLSRKFNQNVQRCLSEGNYHNLIQTVEAYGKEYPVGMVIQQSLAILIKITPYFNDDYFYGLIECFQKMTIDYHPINTFILPIIQLFTKRLQKINTSLQMGSTEIQATYHYLRFGQAHQELQLLSTNRFIKLQKDSPNWVHRNY